MANCANGGLHYRSSAITSATVVCSQRVCVMHGGAIVRMLHMRLVRFLLGRTAPLKLWLMGVTSLCSVWSSSSLLAARPLQLIAKPGYPVKLVRVSGGDYFADFGLDWFGKLQLRITSPAAGRSVTVMMGEKESPADHVDSHLRRTHPSAEASRLQVLPTRC